MSSFFQRFSNPFSRSNFSGLKASFKNRYQSLKNRFTRRNNQPNQGFDSRCAALKNGNQENLQGEAKTVLQNYCDLNYPVNQPNNNQPQFGISGDAFSGNNIPGENIGNNMAFSANNMASYVGRPYQPRSYGGKKRTKKNNNKRRRKSKRR